MRILVVDDNLTIRKMIRAELEDSGYEVFEAKDGSSAIEIFENNKISLITMDIELPGQNGFETVERIRNEIEPKLRRIPVKTPIVFATANDTLEARKTAFKLGAAEYIIKPFLTGELIGTINSILKPDSRFKGLTVLIAEDSGLVGMILESLLQAEGLNTVYAVDGVEALDLFKAHKGDIDLVIADYLMPNMNGEELCRSIRNLPEDQDTPIICLSAVSEQTTIVDLFRAGASDYILKPFAKEELLARIRVHLNSELLRRKLLGHINELKRLSKLKDDFLAITSHDLRSPINGILGLSQLLMDKENLDEEDTEMLTHISGSGEFLLELINDILDLGRIESEKQDLELELVDIHTVINSSVIMLSHMAKPKNIDITVECNCEKPLYILADAQAMNRILNNLLSNAIKFSNPGSAIHVATERLANERVKLTVQDSGIGIAEEAIPQLFEKFSRKSRPGTAGERSTGLGLAIVKELVGLQNGSIDVDSKENEGSCFTLQFPIANVSPDEDIHIEADNERSPLGARVGNVQILLVDDEQEDIQPTSQLLNNLGYRTTCVFDGQEAVDFYLRTLNSIDSTDDSYDLILMDLVMPVMDGFDAVMQIRDFEEKHKIKPIPIIALTANRNDETDTRCKRVGMNGCLSKPIKIEECKELIHRFVYMRKDYKKS